MGAGVDGADSVRRAYDAVAEDYARLLPDTRPEAVVDLAMIDAFVTEVGPAARVLDAGCGAGRISRYLADRGVQVEGIDLSPGMVAAARRAHPDLTFAVGSISAVPYGPRTFDGVVLWYSPIHTPREGQALVYAEARRVLRPGGLVLVGFQAGEGVHDVSGAYRRYGHEVELVRYRYSADEVAGWLVASGFSEVCRMTRPAQGSERDDQAVLIARA